MKPRDCRLWNSSCVACKYRCFLRILIYIWWCDSECWLIYKKLKNKIWEGIIHIFTWLKGSHVIIGHLRKALTQHQKLVSAKRFSLPVSKLSIWGSREMPRESRTRKETPVRAAGKERESSPFPPPLAASPLARSFAASFARYNWRSCSQAAFFLDFEKGKICIKLTG